jgi:GTPase SAR1 family protein
MNMFNNLSGSNTSAQPHPKLNFLVLGDSQIGKSTLFASYIHNINQQNSKNENDTNSQNNILKSFITPTPTQSINIHLSMLPSPTPHHPILLPHFYDLTGSPSDKDDLKVFIKLILDSKDTDILGSFPIHGVFLIFDCGRKTSLESLQDWLKWCDKSVRDLIESDNQNTKFGIEDWGKTPVFIIGNKVDLVNPEPVKMKDILNGKKLNN